MELNQDGFREPGNCPVSDFIIQTLKSAVVDSSKPNYAEHVTREIPLLSSKGGSEI